MTRRLGQYLVATMFVVSLFASALVMLTPRAATSDPTDAGYTVSSRVKPPAPPKGGGKGKRSVDLPVLPV